jgi:TonB family protein
MIRYLLQITTLFALASLLGLSCHAQAKSKKYVKELFAEVAEHQKLAAACERKTREYQMAKFGRVLPKISGHCWGDCPVSIPLPRYPREARQLRIWGQVRVETVVDENGRVIYARAVEVKPFLSRAAESAAHLARYTPRRTCDDKPIKFRWTITYNFILTR